MDVQREGINESDGGGLGWRSWAAAVLAALVGVLLVFGLSRDGAPLLHDAWLPCLGWPVAALVALYIWRRRRPDGPEASGGGTSEYDQMMAWVLLLTMILYFFSSAADDMRYFFLRWMPGGTSVAHFPWHKYGLVRFCVLTAVFMPVLVFCRSRISMWVITFGLLAGSQIACFNQLWHVTGGQALYGDNHPCSMYRLWTYGASFPRLIYYDSLWNGGQEATYLVSTGIIPLGTLLLPLWKLFPVDLIYTPGLALAFMVIVPLLAGLSVRIVGGGWSAVCIGAMLSLGVSQYFFHWFLAVGSVGLCFSLPFLMPVVACLYRVLWMDGFESWNGFLLVFAAAMFLAWPPAVVMMVCLPAVLAANLLKLSVRKTIFISLCIVSVVVLCVPFAGGVFGYVDPLSIVPVGHVELAAAGYLRDGWGHLCDHLRQGNPCLIFFGIVGAWFLPRKGMGSVFGVALLVLAFLAGWGDVWKPQFHMSRAAIPMMFVAVIPAALWMAAWLENPAANLVPVRAALLALLVVCGLNSMRVYANRGPVRYVTMSAGMSQLVEWTRKNGPENGRILFLGSTAREYGKGHIACLPLLTGREMIAQDCFHVAAGAAGGGHLSVPGRNVEALDRFALLYNVHWFLTCDSEWSDFLRQNPDRYEFLKAFGEKQEKKVFRVRQKSGQFISGSGVVRADVNELHVKVDNPLEDAILRYHWEDGLEVDAPVEIYPFNAGDNVRFIAVKPHGKSSFRVSFRKLL